MKKIFLLFISTLLIANVNLFAQDLIITSVFDATLSGGTPKGVELYVVNDIADMSQYGIGSANNGGGSDGEEFTFPADSYSAGDFVYVSSEGPQFLVWFGFATDYISGSMGINGDDAIELFYLGAVIDVFGDPDTDGSGQPWEYLDGWAYRVSSTGPDAAFVLANWTFSGKNALDGESSNATAATPIPVGTFTMGGGTPTVDNPVIDPAGGSYTSTVYVTITCATEDAAIHYTIDGTDPTEASTLYTTGFDVTSTTTVKARAYKAAMDESGIVTNQYNFPIEIANIAALRAQAGSSDEFILTNEVFVTFAQDFRGQKYIQDATAAILIDDNSGVITNDYIIGDGVTGIIGELSEYGGMLQFIPSGQGNETSQGIMITPEAVTITELTNNFEDYEAELIQIMDVQFQTTGVFETGEVYEIQNSGSDSYNFRTSFYDVDYIDVTIPISELDIIVLPNSRNDGEYITSRSLNDLMLDPTTVIAPVISPASGDYIDPITVTITSATPDATIYYTLDGTTPNESSMEYTSSFEVSDNTTVKAIAYKLGMIESSVVTAEYVFLTEVANLAELRAQAGNEGSFVVVGEVFVTFTQDFRGQKYIQDATAAILIDDNSGIITNDYTIGDGITGLVGELSEYGTMLQFIPVEQGSETSQGNTITPQIVTIDALTNNFEDYEAELVRVSSVSFQETGLFETGSVYEIQNTGSESYNFRTSFYDVNYIDGAIPENELHIIGIANASTDGEFITSRFFADMLVNPGNVATPVINPGVGIFNDPIEVSISCSTPGATIYYTIDGTSPTPASNEYDAPFMISETTTVRAIAFASGLNQSGEAYVTYTFTDVVDVENLAELRSQEVGGKYRLLGEAVITFMQDFRNQKYIQDETAAILIDDDNGVIDYAYEVGSGMKSLKGELTEYGNMLQFVPEDEGYESSTGNEITPELITLQDLVNNFENYEAELVRIDGVSFAATGTFENGTVYGVNEYEAKASYGLRTSFYDVNYIGTILPESYVNIVCIANSSTDGEYITPRGSSDITHSDISVEINSNDLLNIYPNPTTNIIQFSVSKEAHNIEIFDIYGKMVMNMVVNNSDVSVDVSTLNGGVYFVKVITSNSNVINVDRFIKK